MKTSIKKDTHTGIQPIRVLKHNLTTRLVERNENYIKQLHSDFKLDKNIKYHIAELPLVKRQCPYIDENGLINIHETYLSYIWIISYYFFVLHEELLVIPEQEKRGIPKRKNQNLNLYYEAEELFNYAKSLIVVYSDWDKENYPNPEYFDENTEQGWYILRTNDLFVEVLNFILYHEAAHAEFEHIKKIKENSLSEEEIKELELEADTRAIELILSNNRSRNSSGLSIIIGIASILFFSNNLNGGKKHPNINIRLNNAIKIFNPEDENPIWSILVLFLKIWDKQFNLGIKEERTYNDYKELYFHLLSQIK
ncbi:phage exclusion protein Lit family protein [Chishuiella sp.]|uniref:phage exclusion protein Lit family protein n=1 Tax=Chishuiella sp. TaxID=1969467 RepID=UPI0028B112C9|nr:phage exclusion protein Lit family protein [Chishuiella sp.]